jgi:intein-encoded DNA endonuclease-like protein
MAKQSTFELYDRLARGRLTARLRRMRAQGLTYTQMAERLRPTIDVAPSTIFRWCRELGIDQEQTR